MDMTIRHYNDLEKNERYHLSSSTDTAASQLGMIEYETSDPIRHSLLSGYGLCAGCKHLRYCRSRYRVLHCSCAENEMALSTEDSVTECTSYEERCGMSLNEMKEIAWLIDLDSREIGFHDD
jgi:hypothetical protein